jgi:small subunit ribosomal protein S21
MSKDISKKFKKNSFKKASKGGESVSQDSHSNEAVLAQPLEVKVYNNNFDKALRAFRALVQKERILSVYKEKQAYEKPSQRRRRKKNEAKRKILELQSDRSKVKRSESSEK